MAGYNILGIIYSIDVKPEGDSNLSLAEEALHVISRFAIAGTYLGAIFTKCYHISNTQSVCSRLLTDM